MIKNTINWSDFEKVDLRIGTIIKAETFLEAKNPAYKVWVDLGESIGIKKSSAQITNYSIEELIGMQVICVVNFEPKQIANFMSEILITGFVRNKKVILSTSTHPILNGTALS